MNEHQFSSIPSTPTQSRRSSVRHSSNTRRKKPSFAKRMKSLLCCGLNQKGTPPLSTILITDPQLQTNLTTNMTTTAVAAADDDQDQWYTSLCKETSFTLPRRYEDLVHVGTGAFGAVVRATDTVTGNYVAIKKMLQPFQTKTHAKRTYRELKLLIDLNHPDAQVVQLYNVFTPEKNLNDFQTLYFVFNFADFDLNKVIKRHLPFSEDHIKQIIYSLLRGLKFIHSAGVIHRDLKPVNIGINQDSDVIILDFGLARVASSGIQTGYVATRWWRAPEVFINWEQYNDKLDVWSVGCIMAELILLRPLFTGKGHIDQLNKIFDVVGTPSSDVLDELCETNARRYISKLPEKIRQDFKKLFGYRYNAGTQIPISGVSEEGVQFLERLLSFDHRSRPTAEEALADPFLKKYRDAMEEPTTKPVIDEHQDAVYEIAKWKSIIWKMIQDFQPPTWATETSDDECDTQECS